MIEASFGAAAHAPVTEQAKSYGVSPSFTG